MAAYKNKLDPDFSDGVDRKLLKQIKERFLQVNEERFSNTLSGLSFRHQDILKVLPLLYQVNHALMPGYVDNSAPSGVSGFEPDKEVLSIAKSFSQTFKFRKDKRHSPQIYSLFIMGSTGTLAHSEASDVDMWLCIAPGMTQENREMLQKKAEKIDTWANDLGLELHTFLMDAEEFCSGTAVSNVDSESSGSAQHYLLLDEFYRTGILLAGRYPLWWIIPPSYEERYRETADMLLTKRFVKESEVIDFGSASHIPKNELVGAGLWQLYKGLDSPYKSVLKILLAEVYAQELPKSPTLSQEFKRAVYDDVLAVEKLDPYVLIYRRLEAYLLAKHELKRLDLVRKSFYLKVSKKLSRPPSGRRASWQRLALESMVKSWAWPDSKLRYLDERYSWKVDQVLVERQELVAELSNSYRFISNFARANNIRSSITSEDLGVLGRKLYAVFQKKAGKIDRVNPGIAPNLWEENLAIHHGSAQTYSSDDQSWLLYRDLSSPADAPYHQVLKKSSGLIDLLSWLYFNGVINKSTRLSFLPGDSKVLIQDVQQIIHALEDVIPQPIPPVPQANFMSPSTVTKLVLFINIGIDPLEEFTEKGMHRLSDRTDSLTYSTERINLVKTIDQVALNSWNELSSHRYALGDTLMQNIQAYLQLCYDQSEGVDCQLEVHCFCPQRADLIAARVRELFGAVKSAFFLEKNGAKRFISSRFVLEIGKDYYILTHVDGQFRVIVAHSQDQLLGYLTQKVRHYSPIVIDRYALEENVLTKRALPFGKKGIIQLFYYLDGPQTKIIVLDENGSLNQWQIPTEEEVIFLSGAKRFVQSMIEKSVLNASVERGQESLGMAFYKIMEGKDRTLKVSSVKNIPDLNFNELTVSIALEEDAYDISLLHRDFTYAEFGDRQIEAMLHHLLHQPDMDEQLPIKVVDIFYPVDTLSLNLQQDYSSTLNTLDYYFKVSAQIQSHG